METEWGNLHCDENVGMPTMMAQSAAWVPKRNARDVNGGTADGLRSFVAGGKTESATGGKRGGNVDPVEMGACGVG